MFRIAAFISSSADEDHSQESAHLKMIEMVDRFSQEFSSWTLPSSPYRDKQPAGHVVSF